jgi:gamma-glutamylcyclotransferase (GGCT)/AIG2-like uncharacterized protein YtfP
MYYVLGYGALTDPVTMLERCPSAVYKGVGTLDDHELYIDRCSSVRPATGVRTVGVVWQITDKDMTTLDKYEGYPYLYERKEVHVNIDNQSVKVWVYYYAIDFKDAGEPASKTYYNTCKQGYRVFGLPWKKQFATAQKKCKKHLQDYHNHDRFWKKAAVAPHVWITPEQIKTARSYNPYSRSRQHAK